LKGGIKEGIGFQRGGGLKGLKGLPRFHGIGSLRNFFHYIGQNKGVKLRGEKEESISTTAI